MTNDPTGKGSSPRVWGQVYFASAARYINGIIPTRMGTRNVLPLLLSLCRDHPHAYGDKFNYLLYSVEHLGSSPRVWGQVQTNGGYTQLWRIIPTRMGTRKIFPRSSYNNRDHPHAYGDKCFHSLNFHFVPGSSPRVWGQVVTALR